MLSEEQFIERYKPVQKANGDLLDYEDVKNLAPEHVWTIIEADNGRDLIASPGFHVVNRLGYVTSSIPSTNELEDAWWDKREPPAVTLIAFDPDGARESHGQSLTVEIEGYGEVVIENWWTENTAGTDCYSENGMGINADLRDYVGDEFYDWLTDQYIGDVAWAYDQALERLGIDELRRQAFEAAKEAAPTYTEDEEDQG